VRGLVATLVLAQACGCAPLTFSDPGAVDFSRYRSAWVTGDGADYLAAELAEISGFESVTTEPGADVDLVIEVSVAVEEEQTCECECECECDDDCSESCTCTSEFDATAAFVARTPAGETVDMGTESDTSATELEAFEDVLDEVALHYIRAYRL
ncbi:MAG TPA: hypothetical protein VFZ53_32870, partial [Polyangiaceae bacterium]